MEFRNGLKTLGDAPHRTIKKFIEGNYTFDDAINATKTSGNANEVYKRFNGFRMWAYKDETKDALDNAKRAELNKIVFELGKIITILKRYNDKYK